MTFCFCALLKTLTHSLTHLFRRRYLGHVKNKIDWLAVATNGPQEREIPTGNTQNNCAQSRIARLWILERSTTVLRHRHTENTTNDTDYWNYTIHHFRKLHSGIKPQQACAWKTQMVISYPHHIKYSKCSSYNTYYNSNNNNISIYKVQICKLRVFYVENDYICDRLQIT